MNVTNLKTAVEIKIEIELAALGRGVKVETIRVELREGETPEQAVARVMAEREGGAATKH